MRRSVRTRAASDRAPQGGPAVRGAAQAASFADGIPLAVLAMVALYTITYGVICAIKFEHALYDDFDLAIFTQAVAGITQGSFFSSIRGMHWLGDHSSLNLLLLAPFHAIFRSPLTLLIAQSAALGLGGIAAFRLAARELASRRAGIAFAGIFLLYPAIGYINLFEFHPEALAVTPLLFAFDALRTGRHRALGGWAALALLAREDVALIVLMMAGSALATRAPGARRSAALLSVLGGASLLLTFAVLRPMFAGPQAEYGIMYRAWGESPAAVLGAVAADPLRALGSLFGTAADPLDTMLKQQYWLHLLGPLAFLPLMSPTTLLIAMPIVFEHMLSARMPQHTIVFQYGALVAPVVFVAGVVGLRNVLGFVAAPRQARAEKSPRAAPPARSANALRMALALPLFATIASQFLFGPLVGSSVAQRMKRPQAIAPTAAQRDIEPYWRRMVERVPSGGVIASFEFLARFADRSNVHTAHHVLSGRYTFSTESYPVPQGIESVIVNLASPALLDYVDPATARRWWDLFARSGLAPLDAIEDIVLFGKSPPGVELCTVVTDAPSSGPAARFGAAIELLGHDPVIAPVPAGSPVSIRTYWRRGAATNDPYLMELLLIDPAGRTIEQRWRHPGYTVFPAHEWPEGATVRETYRLLVPGTASPGTHRLIMRLHSGRGGQRVVRAEPATAPDGFVDVGAVEVAAGPGP